MVILEKVGNNEGLLKSLGTDFEVPLLLNHVDWHCWRCKRFNEEEELVLIFINNIIVLAQMLKRFLKSRVSLV